VSSRILIGDCLERLAALPAESVHCCITSPPYYGLRDYGTATWEGGDSACDHLVGRFTTPASGKQMSNAGSGTLQARRTCPKCGATRQDDQIGLEATPEEHIAKLVEVFRAVRRVLRKDGTLWLNYGDAYTSGGRGGGANGSKQQTNVGALLGPKTAPDGLKPKDLLMMPARVALALQADGWWLRSMMPWVKRSAMPESVTDRPATAIEYVFLLAKSPKYFFDMEAVRVKSDWGGQTKKPDGWATHDGGHGSFHKDGREKGAANEVNGGSRNFRNSDLFYASLAPPHGLICGAEPLALDVNPAGFSEAHFATFPAKLVEPLIKAGTSEKGVCAACGAPWVREVERETRQNWHGTGQKHDGTYYRPNPGGGVGNDRRSRLEKGWSASCTHDAALVPATLLDPFGGADTTALVADRLGRDCILIELNPDYAEMARKRIEADGPLFAELAP